MARAGARISILDDDPSREILELALNDTRGYYIDQLIDAAHKRNSAEIIRLCDMIGVVEDVLIDILQTSVRKVGK